VRLPDDGPICVRQLTANIICILSGWVKMTDEEEETGNLTMGTAQYAQTELANMAPRILTSCSGHTCVHYHMNNKSSKPLFYTGGYKNSETSDWTITP